jgi:hypothetical protein
VSKDGGRAAADLALEGAPSLSLRFLEGQGGDFDPVDDSTTPAFAKYAKGWATRSCGDGRPRPSGRAKVGSAVWLREAAAVLITVIREIFDESAYSRFLSRTQMPSSPQAYAAFRREHEVLKARRPRCC